MGEATTAPSADGRKADLEIITDMLARIDDSVLVHLRDKLRALLHNYSDVFSKDEWDLGWTNVVTHRIYTGNHEPVRQPFRRYPSAHLQAIDKHVADMQRQGIIEPACGPWASNIVLAEKKDGTLRCCVDYRQLNDATRKDAYPLPRTDVCLNAMSGSHWFSTFDLRSSYHQVALDPNDVDKTAFITCRGMYRFRTMPFGLCNAGATFQRLMDLTLTGLNFEVCLAYLDDIIIFSRTPEQHIVRLKQVLERLRRVNLKLKPNKCCLMQVQDGCDKVIAYAKRTLSRNEMNYCVTRKELLAIVHYTPYFRQYLLGRQFTIRTDHAALRC